MSKHHLPETVRFDRIPVGAIYSDRHGRLRKKTTWSTAQSCGPCPGCYQSDFDGSWWCENCDQWPCLCQVEGSGA